MHRFEAWCRLLHERPICSYRRCHPNNALEPVISAKTISYHYGKHHKKSVDDLNKLIAGTECESASLEKQLNIAMWGGVQTVLSG